MVISQLLNAGITGLTQHSGRVSAGDAFIAYRGESRDGRDFILDVVESGAKALVIDSNGLTPEHEAMLSQIKIPVFRVEDLAKKVAEFADAFYQHPSQHIHVIAVTGTNGKSTIAFGINQMYGALDVPVAMIGTLGIGTLDNYVDNPLTTPDPVSLQRNFADFYAQGIETVAMEASSHALAQGRLGNTEIRVAIFTNLTQDHLDYHKTMEAYGEAKALLYKFPSVETVVINLDDAWCFEQIDKIPASKKVIGYTCQGKKHSRCDLTISAVKQGDGYAVSEGGSAFPFHPQLIGDFNISNLLAMMGALRVDGFALNILVKIAERVSGIPGRLECVSQKDEPRVVVDFAHTPDALLKALQALRPTVKGKLWCVFGCGGGRDTTKRPIMGDIAAKYADKVVITTDNSRNDSPQEIADMILAGIPSGKTAEVILDRAEAIDKVIQSAAKEDTVLLAGKGHEKTQVVGTLAMPFSDQKTARNALDKRRTT